MRGQTMSSNGESGTMTKTPKTIALLQEIWHKYRAGERPHPLVRWAESSNWKDDGNAEWIDPDWSQSPTLRCKSCGFTILIDRSIRFDEMCEHFNPAPGYEYPFNEYFAIVPDKYDD